MCLRPEPTTILVLYLLPIPSSDSAHPWQPQASGLVNSFSEEGEVAVQSLVSKDQHWQMQNEGKLEKLTDQGNKIQRPLRRM